MSQHQLILTTLKKVAWLNPMSALASCGTMKLSTRIGELRRAGYVIADKWAELPSGKRVKAYRLMGRAK